MSQKGESIDVKGTDGYRGMENNHPPIWYLISLQLHRFLQSVEFYAAILLVLGIAFAYFLGRIKSVSFSKYTAELLKQQKKVVQSEVKLQQVHSAQKYSNLGIFISLTALLSSLIIDIWVNKTKRNFTIIKAHPIKLLRQSAHDLRYLMWFLIGSFVLSYMAKKALSLYSKVLRTS